MSKPSADAPAPSAPMSFQPALEPDSQGSGNASSDRCCSGPNRGAAVDVEYRLDLGEEAR